MLFDQIQEAVQYIKNQTDFQPKYGIILGTGLGTLTDEMEIAAEIPYGAIPHFPESTVQSHKGKLVFGHLASVPIVAMAGRFHYYEGYSMKQVTFPVRVLKFLNIQHLFILMQQGAPMQICKPAILSSSKTISIYNPRIHYEVLMMNA